jgi:hypothetical protein
LHIDFHAFPYCLVAQQAGEGFERYRDVWAEW